jgi:RNA recognition motif-containing protein
MSFIEEQLNKFEENRFRNSSVYKIAQENNVDSALLEGNEPDKDAGPVKFKELDQNDKRIYLKDVVDFVSDLPRDTMIGLGKGGTNAAIILNNLTNVLGINPDDSYEFIQEKLQNQKAALMDMEKDSPLINKLISMVPQSSMYTVPLYKKFNNAGIPKGKSLILATAIGETLAFDKTETFFVDSKLMQGLKDTMGVPPGSSYEETFDRLVQMGEYGLYGKLFEKIFDGVNTVRKLDAEKGQQGSIAVGGGAAFGAGATQLKNNTESEEKKTLENDDQSMVPGTVNEYGFEKTAGPGLIKSGAAAVFKSTLKETADKIPNKGSGQQILGQITNTPGVKQQEIKWSGLDDFLKGKKSVTKEEVKTYLEQNSLDVSEVQRPRKNTPAEDEQELFLESKMNELDDAIEKFTKASPDALVTNDLDNYKFKSRTLGSGMSEQVEEAPFSRMEILLEDLTEDDLLTKYKYNDKIVIHNLQKENYPFSRTGPLTVEESDRLLESGQYNRTSRYEFEPLEVRKYYTSKMLKEVDRRSAKTAPKFQSNKYNEPGGTDYKELIFKLKGDKDYPIEVPDLLGPDKKTKRTVSYTSPAMHFGTKK